MLKKDSQATKNKSGTNRALFAVGTRTEALSRMSQGTRIQEGSIILKIRTKTFFIVASKQLSLQRYRNEQLILRHSEVVHYILKELFSFYVVAHRTRLYLAWRFRPPFLTVQWYMNRGRL